MSMINPAPPNDELDAEPSYRYPVSEENHSDGRCRWEEHESRTVGGQIQRHFYRVCRCGKFIDRSSFSKNSVESAPSQAVLYANPAYGYDIHFSTLCEYESYEVQPGIFLWIRRCVCTTPNNWRGQSTQQRTNTVRPHAGYGG